MPDAVTMEERARVVRSDIESDRRNGHRFDPDFAALIEKHVGKALTRVHAQGRAEGLREAAEVCDHLAAEHGEQKRYFQGLLDGGDEDFGRDFDSAAGLEAGANDCRNKILALVPGEGVR